MRDNRKTDRRITGTSPRQLSTKKTDGCVFHGTPRGRYEWSAGAMPDDNSEPGEDIDEVKGQSRKKQR